MNGKMKKKNISDRLAGLYNRSLQDHLGAYAASCAYFLVMSFIPFILFLTTVLRYTPLTYRMVREAIMGFVPSNIQPFVLAVLAEVYGKSGAVLPVSATIALWSSGKALQSLINGLNTIYHVKETRNWLITRLRAIFYTLLFVIAIIGSLLLLVLGGRIQSVAARYVPALGKILAKIIGARTVPVFLALIVIFLLLYKMLPNRKASFFSQLPGAVFTAFGWSVFSYAFSLYFYLFPSFTNMYGSLTALVLVMMWLYFCMNIVLIGAEINAYFEKDIVKARQSVQEMLVKEPEEPDVSEL
ncbi:MAG: YihY/virulence factor BrkB family protein [Blautia sp.]|nr:YihY/virulence factor BrkB family protein [Blautia sp.]